MGDKWLYLYYPWMQVKRKIFSIKYLTIILLIGFISVLYTANLRKMCYLTGSAVAPWLLPFFLSLNFYSMIYCALYMYFYSDAPFIQRNSMYHVIRCGRIKWGIIQIESIAIGSLIFNVVSFIVSITVLVPYVDFETGWGKILYTLSRTDAWRSYEIAFNVPYDVIGKYTPLQVMTLTLLLLWLAGNCIGLMMFAVSLWLGRNAAVICGSAWCVLPMILEDYISVWAPFMTHFSPLSWIHVLDIGRFEYRLPMLPDLSYILIANVILCVLFSAAALMKCENYFLNSKKKENLSYWQATTERISTFYAMRSTKRRWDNKKDSASDFFST